MYSKLHANYLGNLTSENFETCVTECRIVIPRNVIQIYQIFV